VEGAFRLNAEITRQAGMVSFVDDYRLMALGVLVALPMLLLVGRARPRSEPLVISDH
jgi:hypothetical protein